MLRRLGYRPEAVADGIEVLQAYEIPPYDIDPDGCQDAGDGRPCCHSNDMQTSAQEGRRIAAITAYGLEGDREKCLEAGMNDYIAKPVKLNELARVVSRYPGISG